jgi:hypothetical protein
MNKKFILFIASIVACLATFSQSISPNENTEFCPLTNVTFTVTLPRIASGTTPVVSAWTNTPTVISGVSNLNHTSTQTTFTFVGRFRDVNIAQMFKVDYTPDGGSASSYYPQFKRIKSLFYGSCTPVQPNRSSITADLCQNQSFSTSFSNVQWKTEFESPSLCFSSVAAYEYRLPNGWQLLTSSGTTTSNGTTWIQDGNSVTVISDAATGNGQAVEIRAINTGCGTGLATGPIVTIPISRPAPSLSITGAATMCYPNSYNYTLNGAPAGSTITWNNTNSYYNVSASGNTASISPTSAANGSTTINATVTLSCGPSFNVSKTVSIGAPYVTFNIVSYPYSEPSCYEVWGIYSFQAQQATGYPNAYTGYQWGWRNLTNSTVSNDPTIYGSQYSFIPEDAGDYEIWVKGTNECGPGILESVKEVTVNNICSGMRMQQKSLSVYPNPTKNNVTVQIPISFRTNAVIQLTNQFGLVVFMQKVPPGSETISIDLSKLKEGIYQLTLKAGNGVKQAKIVKQ